MRRLHFETLRPICPACLIQQVGEFPLEIGWIAREEEDSIEEGSLYCTNPACRSEYPVIDGLPVIVPDARAFLADNVFQFVMRGDLDGRTEALLGECSGPGSALDATRLHLSSYSWDHYGDLDPEERRETRGGAGDAARQGDTACPDDTVPPRPGSLLRAWRRIQGLAPPGPAGPVLDVGCSVGRLAFELAEGSDELVLGVDLNVSMLRLAQQARRTGRVVYPRRSAGLLYERREFPLPVRDRGNVDFWIADGLALPFKGETFGRTVAMNVIDSSLSPLDLLRSLERTARSGGHLFLAAPFDWSGAVTPPESWFGGHSPRAPGEGDGALVLRALLTQGAHPASLTTTRVVGELDDVPWTVRMHDRSRSEYRLHALAARVER